MTLQSPKLHLITYYEPRFAVSKERMLWWLFPGNEPLSLARIPYISDGEIDPNITRFAQRHETIHSPDLGENIYFVQYIIDLLPNHPYYELQSQPQLPFVYAPNTEQLSVILLISKDQTGFEQASLLIKLFRELDDYSQSLALYLRTKLSQLTKEAK